MFFGRLIKRARTALGMSRDFVADQIGLHAQNLGHLERGTKLTSLATFARLRRVLAFDPNELLDALSGPVDEPDKRSVAAAPLRTESEGEHASFGRALAWMRLDAHVTQTALADVVELTRRHVARIESGHALPSLTSFARMRRALKFDSEPMLELLLDRESPTTQFHGFGRAIASARARRNVTLAHAATASGCMLPDYRRFERGEELPTIVAAVRIHRAVRFDANAAFQWLWESGAIEKMS